MKFVFQRVEPREPVPESQWYSWNWQLAHRLKSPSDYIRYFNMDETEATELPKREKGGFEALTTPYYASLAHPTDRLDPIRLMQIPRGHNEADKSGGSSLDPLGEKENSGNVSRIVHRYADRVLFLVTDECGLHCRYCTRKHFVGGPSKVGLSGSAEYLASLEYIRARAGIREVILSGGDPLTLGDHQLAKILTDLRDIPHIEIIRIGSRMPAVCPMRLSSDLAKILRKHNPVYLMTHFNHPRELTLEVAQGLSLIVDHGIPVFNQMVLLNGINNHPAIVQALSRRLLYLRVKPHYSFQCDPAFGTEHLKTSVSESLAIQRELWGHLSGLAMPHFSLDIPGGGGKVPLYPDFKLSEQAAKVTYQGFDGISGEYHNPAPERHLSPKDLEVYLAEWNELLSSRGFRRTMVSSSP